MPNRGFKGTILSALIALFGAVIASPPASGQVVIVKGSNNTYFDQTIQTLMNHVDPATRFTVIEAQQLTAGVANADQRNLFVALGRAAVEAIDRIDPEADSINAYITLEQYRDLKPGNGLTVVLDQPLYRYLAFCKLALGIERLGIIGQRDIEINPQEARILDEFRLQLNQYRVDHANKLLPVLRQVLGQNEALLMLPRQTIYNRDTLKGVLLSSYRNRKPTVSYSPAHVKSGAVASIFSSPVDIGRHLALLLNRALEHRGHAGASLEFARFYTIATNSRVANALGIDLPGERELRAGIDRLQP